MDASKKIMVGEQAFDLPEGVERLSDDGLYSIDWGLIEIADLLNPKDEEFKFFNPRHLGQIKDDESDTTPYLGQGFDRDEMKELLADIAKNGLAYPLLGYWILNGGKLKVRVNDGERRWRCLQRLIDKNEKVWNGEQFLPAKEVYAKVFCRVTSMTDDEALQRACAVSDTAVKWGDGAQARLVKHMYDKGKKDEEICKTLNKSKQWLAETYSLNSLDKFSFDFLLANKINRKVALDLVKVKDETKRRHWLEEAWKDAVKVNERVQEKNERLLEKAESHEELAVAEAEEARINNEPPEIVAALDAVVESAAKKTQERKQVKAASAKPMIKSKNLRNAAGSSACLRAPKIKKQLKAVEELIKADDTSVVDIKTLKTLSVVYQCVLDGEENISNVLERIVKL